MKPQARKVLRHLQAAGAQGVHSRQLRADFIADPPSRVCELRRLGYDISREKEGNGRRYVLRAEGGGGSETAPSPGPRAGEVPLPPGGGGFQSPCAPAADPFAGGVVEIRPLGPKHRYAHQPPDERDWLLVHDYRDRAHPVARWELREGA